MTTTGANVRAEAVLYPDERSYRTTSRCERYRWPTKAPRRHERTG